VRGAVGGGHRDLPRVQPGVALEGRADLLLDGLRLDAGLDGDLVEDALDPSQVTDCLLGLGALVVMFDAAPQRDEPVPHLGLHRCRVMYLCRC